MCICVYDVCEYISVRAPIWSQRTAFRSQFSSPTLLRVSLCLCLALDSWLTGLLLGDLSVSRLSIGVLRLQMHATASSFLCGFQDRIQVTRLVGQGIFTWWAILPAPGVLFTKIKTKSHFSHCLWDTFITYDQNNQGIQAIITIIYKNITHRHRR